MIYFGNDNYNAVSIYLLIVKTNCFHIDGYLKLILIILLLIDAVKFLCNQQTFYHLKVSTYLTTLKIEILIS